MPGTRLCKGMVRTLLDLDAGATDHLAPALVLAADAGAELFGPGIGADGGADGGETVVVTGDKSLNGSNGAWPRCGAIDSVMAVRPMV